MRRCFWGHVYLHTYRRCFYSLWMLRRVGSCVVSSFNGKHRRRRDPGNWRLHGVWSWRCHCLWIRKKVALLSYSYVRTYLPPSTRGCAGNENSWVGFTRVCVFIIVGTPSEDCGKSFSTRDNFRLLIYQISRRVIIGMFFCDDVRMITVWMMAVIGWANIVVVSTFRYNYAIM